ncbi:MAG: hypothetical protein QOI00_1306, partial [Chloroflexota bacterium]|nr:hypothetical protein [Chloroflexota bacterium]
PPAVDPPDGDPGDPAGDPAVAPPNPSRLWSDTDWSLPRDPLERAVDAPGDEPRDEQSGDAPSGTPPLGDDPAGDDPPGRS